MTTTKGHSSHLELLGREALDQPVTPATAAKLCARLGLSEPEAAALLAVPEVSDAEAAQAMHVDIHALAHAFAPSIVEALTHDPKAELGKWEAEVAPRADRVRLVSSACDKLQAVHDAAAASVKVDAGFLQELANRVVPQLRVRARVNDAVRTTYAGLLAYYHSRYPGRRYAQHASEAIAAK